MQYDKSLLLTVKWQNSLPINTVVLHKSKCFNNRTVAMFHSKSPIQSFTVCLNLWTMQYVILMKHMQAVCIKTCCVPVRRQHLYMTKNMTLTRQLVTSTNINSNRNMESWWYNSDKFRLLIRTMTPSPKLVSWHRHIARLTVYASGRVRLRFQGQNPKLHINTLYKHAQITLSLWALRRMHTYNRTTLGIHIV